MTSSPRPRANSNNSLALPATIASLPARAMLATRLQQVHNERCSNGNLTARARHARAAFDTLTSGLDLTPNVAALWRHRTGWSGPGDPSDRDTQESLVMIDGFSRSEHAVSEIILARRAADRAAPPGSPRWVHSDGGRAAAGFVGEAGDCAVRAIAIATGLSYRTVHACLAMCQDAWLRTMPESFASGKRTSIRFGIFAPVYHSYLTAALDWQRSEPNRAGDRPPTLLVSANLPTGPVVCDLGRHVCALRDGVIYDTADPNVGGHRRVHWYYTPPPD